MRLRDDGHAASPLVVITTFVLGAVVLTAIVYAVAFDKPDPALRLIESREGGQLSFGVASTAGGLSWDGLRVRFLDRAGTDQADIFLQLPQGKVQRGDNITVEPLPGAGTYVLTVTHKGIELSRVTVLI